MSIADTIVEVLNPSSDRLRIYHVKMAVTDKSCESSNSCDPDSICGIVTRIPGVSWVSVKRYQLMVERGAAWTWDEIEPEILKLISGMGDIGGEVSE